MEVGSSLVKNDCWLKIICVQQQTPSQIKHASHSPKAEETYIPTIFIVNVPINHPYCKFGKDIFFNNT